MSPLQYINIRFPNLWKIYLRFFEGCSFHVNKIFKISFSFGKEGECLGYHKWTKPKKGENITQLLQTKSDEAFLKLFEIWQLEYKMRL